MSSFDLKVLRKIDLANCEPGTHTYLWDEYLRRKISIDPDTNRPRADVVDPRTGYVDNDLPRDEAITLELMEKTTGFAISSPTGQVLGRFSTFADAEKARQGASVKLDYQIEGIDDAEDEPDENPLAGIARRERDRPAVVHA